MSRQTRIHRWTNIAIILGTIVVIVLIWDMIRSPEDRAPYLPFGRRSAPPEYQGPGTSVISQIGSR
jgi:hypothetical protein